MLLAPALQSDLNDGVVYLFEAVFDAPRRTHSPVLDQLLVPLIQPLFAKQRIQSKFRLRQVLFRVDAGRLFGCRLSERLCEHLSASALDMYLREIEHILVGLNKRPMRIATAAYGHCVVLSCHLDNVAHWREHLTRVTQVCVP